MFVCWLLGTALASPALSPPHGPPMGPPGGPPHGPPPPELLVHRALEAGVPAEVVSRMQQLVDDAEPALDAARDESRDAHEELRELMMGGQTPDRKLVLAASRAITEAEDQLRELHLVLELDLRAQLTPEQWASVRPPPPPRGGPGRPEGR